MNGYEFTWISALKLLGGIVLIVVWIMMRQQAKLDKVYKEENEKAKRNMAHRPCRGSWSVPMWL